MRYLLLGLGLGLAAGVSPGPMLALITLQTLRHGTREGMKTALAPLLTDVPIVTASILLLSRLAATGRALGAIALAGALYLVWLAWQSFQTAAPQAGESAEPPGSLGKAFLTNMLNPHVYLFWAAVGAPTVVSAWRESPAWAVLFIAGFYFCLIGAKLVLAALVG
ncbi:MAG: LysE family transporter, partial [Acidobacteria bacterium]|nr:LysE family transporter [Acidobacteriota bacterium]